MEPSVPKCDSSESSWPPGAKEKCLWETTTEISYTKTGRYAPKTFLQFCASEACMSAIAAMKASNPSECVTTIEAYNRTYADYTPKLYPAKHTFLYADIVEPVEDGCRLVNTPSIASSNAPHAQSPVPTPLSSRRPDPVPRQPTTASSSTSDSNATASTHADEPMGSQSTDVNPETPTAILSDQATDGAAPTLAPSSSSSGSGYVPTDARSISPTRSRGQGQSSTVSTSAVSSSSISPAFIGVLIGSAVVFVIGTIVLYVRRKRRPKLTKSVGDGYSSSDTHESASMSDQDNTPGANLNGRDAFLLIKPLATWRVDSAELKDIRLIGGGGQGAVYLVRLNTSRLLASKRLIPSQANERRLLTLVAEAQLVATLQHASIVSFVGVAWTTPSTLQLLFEYTANGDLRGHLDRTKSSANQKSTTWTLDKLQIAVQIAEGLVYVHSFMPPIVHRDVKAKNILLDDDMSAKISDFGAARSQSEEGTMTTGVGSSRWLAPEVITGGGEYTERCDIYAFGVLMTELDTHELPYAESSLSEVLLMQQVVQNNIRPSVSATCDPAISELIEQCMQADPLDRPNALELSFRLRQILKSKIIL